MYVRVFRLFLKKQEHALAVGHHDVDLVVAIEILSEELRPDARLVIDLVRNELGRLSCGGLYIEPIQLARLGRQ